MFWASTPHETKLLIEELGARRKAEREDAYRRVGVIAALYATVNYKGRYDREDFVPHPPRRMGPKEALSFMDAWADDHNKRIKA